MKSEKGISLISLIIYLIAFTTAVAIVANVSNYFYKNLTMSGNSLKTNEQFLKLNSYLTKEINIKGNVIKSIGDTYEGKKMNYIVFASTKNQYSFINGEIYFNQTKICSDINDCKFTYKGESNTLVVNIKITENNIFQNSYKISI